MAMPSSTVRIVRQSKAVQHAVHHMWSQPSIFSMGTPHVGHGRVLRRTSATLSRVRCAQTCRSPSSSASRQCGQTRPRQTPHAIVSAAT